MQTDHALDLYIQAKHAKALSPRTLSSYHQRLSAFARLYPALPLTPEPIEAYLSRITSSDETRYTHYKTLRGFYRWLKRRKHISDSPMDDIETTKRQRKVGRGFTPDELDRLLHNTDFSPHERAMVRLLADTGLRLSEALSVVPEHVYDTYIVVKRQPYLQLKTGERIVPVSPETALYLRFVLPWPWRSEGSACHAIRRLCREVGIEGKQASAHAFRRTFVRHWEGRDSTLVDIMGWATSKMLSHYKGFNLERAIAEHQQFSPLAQVRNEY